MSDSEKKVKGHPINNILYTKESKSSLERAKGELVIPDPDEVAALEILKGEKPKDSNHESQSS